MLQCQYDASILGLSQSDWYQSDISEKKNMSLYWTSSKMSDINAGICVKRISASVVLHEYKNKSEQEKI